MADIDPELADSARKYWHKDGWAPGGVMREVDYALSAKGVHRELQGIKIVDCDTHFTEPADMYTSLAPARYKDKMPTVRRIDGVDRWFVGDRDFGSMIGGNVIRRSDNHKLLGRCSFPTGDEGHEGVMAVKPRLQAMDDMGIYAQICFQNSGVTQAGSLMALDDPELGKMILRIYNDAAIARQEESGQRMFTMAMLPIWDKAAMEAEALRCLDLGFKGFVLPDTPESLGIPAFIEGYWTPFLELCSDRGAPLNFHLNASIDPTKLTWKGFAFEQTLSVVATMFSICNAATLGNWMVSGLLDRHPKLKIGLIESGMGWVPFALEALEHQFDEMLPSKSKILKRRPWEYFHDQFWCSFWFEKIGPWRLLDVVGFDNVMFETDFPHPTSLYPGVQDHIVEALKPFDYSIRKKVLQDNPSQLYNIEL